MTDTEIIHLLWERNEDALIELNQSYGAYCYSISYQIVQDREDANECLNDTWFQTWNSIPDKRPASLRAFVAKIARNLSLNRVIHKNALKRGSGTVHAVFDELAEMIGTDDPIEAFIDRQSFIQNMNCFLKTLNPLDRNIFLLRFWYFKTPKEIALRFSIPEYAIYNSLNRVKKQLRRFWPHQENTRKETHR